MIAALAVKSLRNRKLTAILTILSIALSVLLLLGVERIRHESRESFAATISGTDLVVGARTSPVNLLLSAVFHIGNATNNIGWNSYRAIADRADVAWTIPLSLGDSHRGYRVLGTTPDYFEHFRFARARGLVLEQGMPFHGEHDAVLGADVAKSLHYHVGDSIVIAHGAGEISFVLHDQQPFRVAGILARTGTPVDRTVHVSLAGLDALHEEIVTGADPLAAIIGGQHHENAPRAITAFLVGLKSRGAALSVQRAVNEYAGEPLTAALPGVALQEVWEITGAVEQSLFAVSVLVVAVGLSGMLVSLLTSLGERRREMAVLRSLGSSPAQIFSLILGEAAFLTVAGILAGVVLLYIGLLAGQSWFESRFGLYLGISWLSAAEWGLVGVVAAAGLLIGLLPAWRSYRRSLADGMIVRS
ncbi:MAG TPA: FtsX-like permease family protein [Steroidobacteraceae bacterium]|nr:FtsX-like permease family protein [Steroidobacteraceae bacterium]